KTSSRLKRDGTTQNHLQRRIAPTLFLVDVGRIDADLLPVLSLPLEGHHTVDQGEKGIILSPTNVVSRKETGSTLTDDNAAGKDRLTAEALDAEILWIGV